MSVEELAAIGGDGNWPLAWAIEHARGNGAGAIEGYPVNTEWATTSKIGSGELCHGTVRPFTSAGFGVDRGAGQRCALVRSTLNPEKCR